MAVFSPKQGMHNTTSGPEDVMNDNFCTEAFISAVWLSSSDSLAVFWLGLMEQAPPIVRLVKLSSVGQEFEGVASVGARQAGVKQLNAAEAFLRNVEDKLNRSAWGMGAPKCCRASRPLLFAVSMSPMIISREHMQLFQCACLIGDIKGLQTTKY